MKKSLLPLLLCAALLCGCGGEKPLAVQGQYRTVTSADMEAEVVSHTATDDRTFTLTCRYDREGQSVTTVKAPEELKGLTAVLVDGELSLKSNGQRLTLQTTGHSGSEILCAVWLDESSLIPRYAEFSQNGKVVLTARMISFACTTDDTPSEG